VTDFNRQCSQRCFIGGAKDRAQTDIPQAVGPPHLYARKRPPEQSELKKTTNRDVHSTRPIRRARFDASRVLIFFTLAHIGSGGVCPDVAPSFFCHQPGWDLILVPGPRWRPYVSFWSVSHVCQEMKLVPVLPPCSLGFFPIRGNGRALTSCLTCPLPISVFQVGFLPRLLQGILSFLCSFHRLLFFFCFVYETGSTLHRFFRTFSPFPPGFLSPHPPVCPRSGFAASCRSFVPPLFLGGDSRLLLFFFFVGVSPYIGGAPQYISFSTVPGRTAPH